MSIIRATLMICVTILISVVAVIFFNNQNDRFVITSHKDGIFIFDHKTSATNYCTTTQCKMISSEFVLPKFTTIVETIPTNAQQISPQATQSSQLVNPNFGMANTPQAAPPAGAPGAAAPAPGVPNQFAGDVKQQTPQAGNPPPAAAPQANQGGNGADEEDNGDGGEENADDAGDNEEG